MSEKTMPELAEQSQKDAIVSDWANDPDNAKNWSTAKKLYNTAVPALLCFLM
jgi:hypothetical protein